MRYGLGVVIALFWVQVFHLEAGVVINEILADPPSGDPGDANKDGTRHGTEDEFVEILNTGSDTVNIGGWKLSDKRPGSKGPFTFPPNTRIAPGEYIVLFGGGMPKGCTMSPGSGKICFDDGTIGGGLSNSADAVFLVTATSDTVSRAEWGKEGGKDQSLVRYPEGTGGWVLHTSFYGRGLFSPGKARAFFDILQSLPEYLEMTEGESASLFAVVYKGAKAYREERSTELEGEPVWVSRDTSIVRIEHGNQVLAVRAGETEVGFLWRSRESIRTTVRVLKKKTPPLVISEVHPNPAWGKAGDTNGDGVRHTYQDEFVEVGNTTDQPIDIGGYFLGDDDVPITQRFRFPDNTTVEPQSVVVLFGGGKVAVADRVFADDGRIGDGLANWRDTVLLLASDSSTVVASMGYERSTRGISFSRDENGNYRLHNEIYKDALTSVGRLTPADHPIETEEVAVRIPEGLVFSEILMLPNSVDANNDGIVERHADVFVELTNIGADTLDLSGWLLGDDDIAMSRFYSFPDRVALAPGGYVTVFGGGTPLGIPGVVLSANGRIGNGLAAHGDVVHLLMPDAKTVARSIHLPKATPDVSWLLAPDVPPALHPKIPGWRAMSPGTPPPTVDSLSLRPIQLVLAPADSAMLRVSAHLSQGSEIDIADRATWHTEGPEVIELHHSLVVGKALGEIHVHAVWREMASNVVRIVVTKSDSIATIDPADRDSSRIPEGLVISEVYPNPGTGNAGDTNGDGVRHTYQDEFVEVANIGEHPIDIGGYFLGDDDVPITGLFRFPHNTTLDPQTVVVLFGGGNGNRFFADDGRIGDGLANGGDTVRLLASDGSTVVASMVYKRSTKGVSFARNDSGNYLLHNEINEGEFVSVGRLSQREAFPDRNGIAFSEILMWPKLVDANNDGVVNRHADAFVELTNMGADTLDLSGWLLGDDDIAISRFFSFPDDVVLLPGGIVTVFGGGTPVDIPGTVLSAEGKIGNGLSSRGDVVHLALPNAKTVVRSVRVPKASPDISWLFSRNAPPTLHPKTPSGHAMSPGTFPRATDTLSQVVSGKPAVVSEDSTRSTLEIGARKWGIYPSPNPFNAETVLGFYSTGGPVEVTIYNILGQPIRRLVQQHLPAGYYRRVWDGKNDAGASVGSGIYIVFLKDKEATFIQRVALLK